MDVQKVRCFILSAGSILLAAAVIRFIIAAGDAQSLALSEPLLGLPLRFTVLTVGVVELAVALVCLFGQQLDTQIGWLMWLFTNFIAFWIGLMCMHRQLQGACIGSLTDPLRINHGVAGHVLQFLPFCLALGSYAAGLWLWFSKEAKTLRYLQAQQKAAWHDSAAGWLKMACPACGGHIKFAAQNLGQKIPCPHCRKETVLRKPDLLKMSCFFCQGHIEFPPHALGQKMSCPHCNMDITLKEPT